MLAQTVYEFIKYLPPMPYLLLNPCLLCLSYSDSLFATWNSKRFECLDTFICYRMVIYPHIRLPYGLPYAAPCDRTVVWPLYVCSAMPYGSAYGVCFHSLLYGRNAFFWCRTDTIIFPLTECLRMKLPYVVSYVFSLQPYSCNFAIHIASVRSSPKYETRRTVSLLMKWPYGHLPPFPFLCLAVRCLFLLCLWCPYG